ncbi:class I adenylate-forming enzyme family protein [Sphingosinicella microcystinivorans]|uniref:class I adenylate-forming enzyme family protein n=1 Tax=Sphingosinicella microcystinivorans TaxID=335406 RepID=UPI0022F38DA7|nr:class I adenylate-forming enzyme family protein [Sphingosinicella microcystinivorans]WBX86150.1 class I adenylate-forming enzyme family protein [Sphingosinicella microcystinivorans]
MAEDIRQTFSMSRRLQYGDRVVKVFTDRPQTVYRLLADSAARTPDAPAVFDAAIITTYGELDRLAGAFAGVLDKHGIRAGDRCAIYLGNSLEFVIAVLGCAFAGVVSVPVGARLRAPEIAYVMENSGASALIHDAALSDQLPDSSATPSLLVLDVGAGRTGRFWAELNAAGCDVSPAAVSEEDTAVLIYTSGTTGRPKGVMLSHAGLVHSALHFAEHLGFRFGERFLLAVPGSHITGLAAVVLEALYLGGAIVIQRHFKVDRLLDLIAGYKVNSTVLVPAMYNLLLLQPDFGERDLSSWHTGIFGGAPMPPATISELARRLPRLQLVNGYGATEASSAISLTTHEQIRDKPECVGFPVACADVVILDDAGCEVLPGEVGQLHVGGPMVAKGYWNDAAATTREFAGGYWRSGDLASVDDEGAIFLRGRVKDMINRGGYKIYPVEVENVISAIPGVIECAVFGYADSVLGEKSAAVVVVGDEEESWSEIVRDHCLKVLADYKCPDNFRFTAEPLPKNANGKTDKGALKGLHTA